MSNQLNIEPFLDGTTEPGHADNCPAQDGAGACLCARALVVLFVGEVKRLRREVQHRDDVIALMAWRIGHDEEVVLHPSEGPPPGTRLHVSPNDHDEIVVRLKLPARPAAG